MKREQGLLRDHLLCPFLPELFFRRQEAICLQTKHAAQYPPDPHLPSPSFNNPSLKYLRVLYSSSVPSDCAVELNCTVWYVQVFSKNVHHNDKYLHLSCHSCSRRPVYCLQTARTKRNDCYTKGQRQFGFSSSFQSCLLASSPFIVPQLCTF